MTSHTPLSFQETCARHGVAVLRARSVSTLQVNVGKRCNQACAHCHVDAGPLRTEAMSRETMDAVIAVIRSHRFDMVDITGGAPELHPLFRELAQAARAAGATACVRHNLTVQFEPGLSDLPTFFRDHQVELIASLPCYTEETTDAQRGRGVFQASIRALRRLNDVGYGQPNSGLTLNLVYNPSGPNLPPPQAALEADYHHELRERYGIVFNRLFTITNMPIRRFLLDLRRTGEEERYMETLQNAFNPATLDGLMCRDLISVSWDGRLHDCDFNQMVGLPLTEGAPQTIHDFDLAALERRRIVTARHCFGCTAGAGSSCGGALVAETPPYG